MDEYRCNFCGNMVTYGENHPCSFDAFDSSYSYSRPFSENTSNSTQLGTHGKLPSFDVFRVNKAQTKGITFFTDSSENGESWYRNENEFCEAYSTSTVVMESTGVKEDTQIGSGISDRIQATGREDEMSCQENKWLSLNKNTNSLMDSSECVIRKDVSDNSIISRPRNLEVNPDFLLESIESEKGKKHVSEFAIDGHTLLEMHSNPYSKSKKTATSVTKHISSADNKAVPGPSGMCSSKKKFPCTFCPKEFRDKSALDIHYRTHTKERPFECNYCEKAFSTNGNLKNHIRTHTGEKPFVCKVCKNAYRESSALKKHMRTHTGEKPYECPVCGRTFGDRSNYNTHRKKMHK